MLKRIGVLTGGGDCPGLNAVIRAIYKTAATQYHCEVYGFRDGYHGLVLNDYFKLKNKDVSGILDRGGTILGTSNRDNPFHFKVDEESEYADYSDQAIRNLKELGIDCLIVIGGDGTQTSARDFFRKGVPVVSVPKTIDNDLAFTDLTFGFMTAVDTATVALDKLHSTAESHHRIMILEVMGRYAGWIALEAGLAGGADVILIPEIPYQIEKIAEKIQHRKTIGKMFSIVIVAEGAKPLGGKMVVSKVDQNCPDPVKLGGIGQKLGVELEKATGFETRVTVLGHVQRGGAPSAFDRILSTRYGVAAVEFAVAGKFGMMTALQGTEIVPVPIADAVGKLKTVPLDSDYIKAARSIDLEFGD